MIAASVVGIERGSRFVEKKNGRVFQESARDADALPLPDAEMPAAFADRAVVSVRQVVDKAVGLRPPGGFANFRVGRIRPAVGDVLADGRGKKKCVLEDDRDLLAQRFFRDLTQVAPIQPNDSRSRIVKARDETEEGGFARAGSADEGDDLVWRNR